MLRVWNLSLVISTFSLTILGTFITRSGVLQSVHAFGESGIGPWLLTFFAIIVLVSLGLIAWRGDELRAPGKIDSPVSREGAFLANNVLFAAFACGCAGSTAGGIKMIRVLMIYLQGMREVKRLIHPNGVFTIKLGRESVADRRVDAVWSFFSVYVFFFLLSVCTLMVLSDIDFITAFSAVGACLNNLGPGLGDVAANYNGISAEVKWVLMFNMVLGRLEIFTLLVLLTPAYWRR